MTTRVDHELSIEYVPLDQLDTYPGNARLGDVDAIADSMDENGIFDAIVVQRSTGYVLDGNHRYMAMQQMGEEKAPVIWVEVDDERARRIVLVANRLNDVATYDTALLVELLQDLPDLTGTGYDDETLADLLKGLDDVEVEPEEPEKLGGKEHTVTVICADSDEQTRVFEELDAEGYNVRITRSST